MSYNEDGLREQTLDSWVMSKVSSWRDHYRSNYQDKHEEYARIWRGIWSGSDKLRDSERSKLISPATQQAVESAVAEVEEATFGRGKFFDIRDDHNDQILLTLLTCVSSCMKTSPRLRYVRL